MGLKDTLCNKLACLFSQKKPGLCTLHNNIIFFYSGFISDLARKLEIEKVFNSYLKNKDPKLSGNENENVGISSYKHFSIFLFQATQLLRMWRHEKGKKASFENFVKALKEIPLTTFLVEEMTKAQSLSVWDEVKT